MVKRELDQSQVQVSLPFRKHQGRKSLIRLVRNYQASIFERKVKPPVPSVMVAPQKRHGRHLSNWWLFWLIVFSLVGGTLAVGVIFLTKLPPPVNCQRISALSVDGDRLYCAQKAAESGKLDRLVAALRIVGNWPREHPLYSESQRLLEEWSKTIIAIAKQQIEQGDRSQAVQILEQIPLNSPFYGEARATIATWEKDWQQGELMVSQFKDALVVQNWTQASKLITALSRMNYKYWSVSRVDIAMKQLGAEKEAWQQLQDARDLAQSNEVDRLEEAIAKATKVNPNSYVKAQAQAEVSKWSRTLLDIGKTLFQNQDFAGMVAVAGRIPVNTSLYQEAQDWIRLGRAAQIVKPDNLLTLVDALSTVRKIPPQSKVYSSSTSFAKLWEQQLQDYLQLQLAGFTASIGQETTLQMAIQQASLIAPNRPQRLRSQSLIAQWRKEIQEIEDRKTLRSAQQIAAAGNIAQLKAAVAQASQIKLNQPLRLAAQNEIAKWNRQIETLEDRPILDLAKALAQRRDLTGAISTASQIRANRALYPQAQQEITQWVAKIQAAEDRPILEAANALAAQRRFQAAIATAAQITPERSLYQQAQNAIALWQSQISTTTEN